MLPLLAQTATDSSAASRLVFWIAFGLYVVGVIQYFRGNHVGMGWAAIFVPFMFIGGYFIKPKPGSSRYMKYDDVKKAHADLRWPMHAKAYHDLMGDKDPKAVTLVTPVTPTVSGAHEVVQIPETTETPEDIQG